MHTETKTEQPHLDSLGQRNPAIEMEKVNIAAARKRTEENENLPGTARSRLIDERFGAEEKTAAPSEGKSEKQDYEAMTVPELRELAKDRGVDVGWDARKDEIVTALEKHDKKH